MSESEIDATNIFGPLSAFMADPTIEEIWINSPERIFVARSGRSELTMLLLSAEQVRNLELLKRLGNRCRKLGRLLW
jgi:pilus assembly protein CpaF